MRKSLIAKFKYNIIMGVLFPLFVLLPDYIFQLIYPNVHYLTDVVFILVIAVFGFFLSMSGIWMYILCCGLFIFMQLIQLGHIAYFSRPINPLDIGKVFNEFSDIYSASVTDIDDFWFIPLMAVLPFLILIILEIKWRKKLYFSVVGILAVIIFLGVKPERATRRGLHHFLPPETRYSIHNSINSFSFYLVRGMDKKNIRDIVPNNFYKSYVVEKHDSSSNLVIFVMGESTSAEKMHIFNNDVNPDTPLLEKFIPDTHFYYQKAVSGGVSTHASLPIFFNLMKEPGNINKLLSYDTNLFKLAKENGYKTYFLSAYDMKQLNLIGVPYIDEMVTSESNPRRFKTEKEDYLLDLLKSLDLKQGKNFVVLNFRSVHSPYEKNYEHHQEFNVFAPQNESRFAEENAAYENSILYIDSVLAQMIEYFKSLNVENSQFIFTSDHAEMLGIPDGRYGHNQLLKQAMIVPFIMYNIGTNTILPEEYISHYEIAKLIAFYLGYDIKNPNFAEDDFFVHGNNLFEEYQFLQIHRNEDNTINIDKPQTIGTYIRQKTKKH